MNCELATTGTPVGLLLLLAAAFLIAGAAFLAASRPSLSRGNVVVLGAWVIAIGCVTSLIIGVASAGAATCGPAGLDLVTITQTSTNDGLAPGVAPSPLTGRITNNGPVAVLVTAVTVSIADIDLSPTGDRARGCSIDDYTLYQPRMPVGRLLASGQSLTFTGASIGFHANGANQNGCKHANLILRYVSS